MAQVRLIRRTFTRPDGSTYEDYYEDLGSGGGHIATSWEVALDPEFTKIIDASYFDKVNLTHWVTPLPKRKEDLNENSLYGDVYTNLKVVYARARIFCGNIPKGFRVLDTDRDEEIIAKCNETLRNPDPSAGAISYTPWSPTAVSTQRYQQVVITEEGKDDIVTDSDTIGMNFDIYEGDK